jgi:hypothetical protein
LEDAVGRAFVPVPLRALRQVLHAAASGASACGLHATERFLERLAEYASHGDISSAARFTGVPEKTAERWYYDYLERKQKEPGADLLPIRSLGIDELSLKKDTGSSAAC